MGRTRRRKLSTDPCLIGRVESTTMAEACYTSGSYLEKNPLWHTEESSWKAEQIMRMLNRHNIVPRTICEVGCGAGEVLRQLQPRLGGGCEMLGCDVYQIVDYFYTGVALDLPSSDFRTW
jgi:hypothetical protein